jgi:hypothetical protein
MADHRNLKKEEAEDPACRMVLSIFRLRKKLEALVFNGAPIQMIRGWGVSITLKKKPLDFSRGFTYLAPRPGLEPGTYGLPIRFRKSSSTRSCESRNF